MKGDEVLSQAAFATATELFRRKSATVRLGTADGKVGTADEKAGASDEHSIEASEETEECDMPRLNGLAEEELSDKQEVSLSVDADIIPAEWVREAIKESLCTKFSGYDQIVLPYRVMGLVQKLADLINQEAKQYPKASLLGWHRAIDVANRKLKAMATCQ